MKEFPHKQYVVVRKLKESTAFSTFVVRSRGGDGSSQVLRFWSGPPTRRDIAATETNICWQKGLVHPYLAGVGSAGLLGKNSLYTTREFAGSTLDLAKATPAHIRQVLDAVCFLHRQGKIHGGLKPSNLFLVDGNVRVADMRLLDCEAVSTPDHVRFTAPEVLAGKPPTVESDYYALGAILYRVFSGRDPFDDSSLENLKAKYLHAKMPEIQNTGSIRDAVTTAIGGLLHRNPRRRVAAFGALIREFPFEACAVAKAPVVGRSDMLEFLQSFVIPQAPATFGVCLLEGDAGIGKSRLIEELVTKCRFQGSALYVSACGHQTEQSLSPTTRLIQTVLQAKHNSNPESILSSLGGFTETLGPLFDDNTESLTGNGINHSSERIIQDLIGLIGNLSRQESLKLCIEDIDKSEPVTLTFLKQLSYRASDLNVRLILTCRDSSVGSVFDEMRSVLGDSFSSVTLEPLTTVDSRKLIGFWETNRGKQAELLRRAGGNPLWLTECARVANSQSLALSIYRLIREEDDAQGLKLAQALAVHRGSVSVELLAQVVGLDRENVAETLLWLRKSGVVNQTDHSFEIPVESLRSAIVSDIPPRTKRNIHAAFYKILKTHDRGDAASLADHAYGGGLWEQAASDYAGLARNAANRGDYVTALNFYGTFKIALRKLNREIPPETEGEIAICLSKTGKPKKAEQILKRLLAESEIDEKVRSRLCLVPKGEEIDGTYIGKRVNLLRQAIESSKGSQSHPSVLFSKFCASCVTTGDFVGAADALTRAQLSLQAVADTYGQDITNRVKGFFLMNKGDFQNASEIYRQYRNKSSGITAAAMTNRAICLAHLGNIRSAIIIQKRAYRLATKIGHLIGRCLCLGNLGDFNTRLGNFKEAHDYFEQMKKLVAESASSTKVSFKGVEVEEAGLEHMEGRYQSALHHLRTALNSTALLPSTRQQCSILECEIQFSMGVDVDPSDVDNIARPGSWSESPLFAVQEAVLRSRTQPALPDALTTLKSALTMAQNASLLYETCKIDLALSARLRETDAEAAKFHAEEAEKIAKKNGYRPLLAKSYLLRGQASDHRKEREHYLGQSLKLASEVGIPEIVSESSYELGVSFQSTNRSAAAKEHLTNSTRIITELAAEIPARLRSGYFSSRWRNDARKRHESCLREQPLGVSATEKKGVSKDHLYFQALYRISVAADSAQTIEEFLRELLPAIGHSRASIVVMLKFGDHTSWYSLGISVTDELRQQVLSVATKSRNHLRFDSRDRWIPFRSLHFSGGIHVQNRKPIKISEDELEFFTILGTFVSSALDQIHNRAASRPVTITTSNFHGIVGTSRPTREMCSHIETIANNNATVLIQGETGTGKELVARAIHKLSSRSKAAFIAIDCGAIAEGLMESELFGSKRGSFTGAVADRPGVFEAANQGTLFLDEISNMNLGMQAKLLRVLQEREVRRVGETKSRPVDVRLIAASNTNLKRLVAEGAFRQDLLFRLNVIEVNIPPLRARLEDIAILAAHFLNQLNSAQNTNKVFSAEALQPLLSYNFPGNIRELQNSIERGFFTASGRTISSIPVETVADDTSSDEVKKWFAELAEGRRNFWTTIHDRYKRRDIPREQVVALVDLGLRTTHGSYKNLASLFRIHHDEYRRLMDFLRRNNCLLDFRPYRKTASLS